MPIKPSYRQRWKFSDDDAAFVATFEAAATRLGISRQRIEQAFEWYCVHGREGRSPDQLRESFEAFTTEKRWSAEEVSGALAWYDMVQERGVGSIELDAAPSHADNEKRLAEIRKIAAQDPDAYNADRALQTEHMDLIAAGQGSPAKAGADADASAAGDGVAAARGRLTQIRDMRRNEPDAYDANRGVQNEELQLLALPGAVGTE